MICVDYSGTSISAIMADMKNNPRLNADLIRHMVLNSLRSVRSRFYGTYGELVICCDGPKVWRKDVYPYYKAKRKVSRDNSGIDWQLILSTVNKLRDELKETFPYKVLQVEGAEADDIIATLCRNTNEPSLIVSKDKDFLQLLSLGHVSHYSPKIQNMWTVDDPRDFLEELILKGDSIDGVPNIMADPDVFMVPGKRQPPMTKKRLEAFKQEIPPEFRENYERNKKLVSLFEIPEPLVNTIMETYRNCETRDRSGLLDYFIKHRLAQLSGSIGDF